MLAAVLKNEMAWFDQEENESSRITARLELDANNVMSAIGDRISVIMQNSALLLVVCSVGFALQWRLALVLIAVFPIVVDEATGGVFDFVFFFFDIKIVELKFDAQKL